jgi:site-specific DNA recombinase
MSIGINTMQAIGYRRVSTDGQEDNTSLESQAEKIRAMAVCKGFDVAEIISDVASGKSLERQGITQVISLIQSGSVQAVIVAKLDRLTRSLRDLLSLLDLCQTHKVALISVAESIDTETPIGRLMINVLGSVAEFERETIASRMADGRNAKRAKNGRIGQVPYGFMACGRGKESRLEPNPAELLVIDRMKALKASGTSLQGICDALETEGIKTRKGSTWKPQYVHSILKARNIMQPSSHMIS